MEETLFQFQDAFYEHDRGNQFSYESLCALYEFLEEEYPNWELDVVELCCEFIEYDNIIEAATEKGFDWDGFEDMDDGDKRKVARRWLEERTSVITTNTDSVLVRDF